MTNWFSVFSEEDVLEPIESIQENWELVPWYSAEKYWLSRETVYDYRQRVFSPESAIESWEVEESDWLFLYEWSMKNDPTGRENWWRYFNQIPESTEYWGIFGKAEKSVWVSNPELWKVFSKCENIWEYGPWLWKANKFKHYLYDPHLHGNWRNYNHVWQDVSWSITEWLLHEYDELDNYWKKKYKNIIPQWINQKREHNHILNSLKNKGLIMFWWSIWNYPKWKNVEFLKGIIETISKWYNHKTVNARIAKWFESLWIPIDKVEFTVQYKSWEIKFLKYWSVSKNSRECEYDKERIWWKLLEDITISLWNGKFITKKAWEYIRPINSRRYSDEQIIEMYEEAWYKTPKIFDSENNDLVSVSLSTTPTEKFTPIVRKSMTMIALLLSVWGVWFWIWSINENLKNQKRIDDLIDRATISWNPGGGYWNIKDSESKRMALDSELVDYIASYEKVFSTTLSSWEKERFLFSLIDWLRENNLRTNNLMTYWWMWWWATDMVVESLDQFLHDNIAKIEGMWLKIKPYEVFRNTDEKRESLYNSFHYEWEDIVFEDVDIELPPLSWYVSSRTTGLWKNRKPDFLDYKSGIKFIEWKPFFLVQWYNGTQDWNYVLFWDSSKEMVGAWYPSYQKKLIHGIIKQWEVNLLLKEIEDLLWSKNGSPLHNSQIRKEIIYYLLDMYAEWFDLWYLIWWEYKQYHNERDKLDAFIQWYILQDIPDKITWTGIDSEKFIDWKLVELKPLVWSINDYLYKYTKSEISFFKRELESKILFKVLETNAWELIDDEWWIRSRLVDNMSYFNELWFEIKKVSSPNIKDCNICRGSWPDMKYRLVTWEIIWLEDVWNKNSSLFNKIVFWNSISNEKLTNSEMNELRELVRNDYVTKTYWMSFNDLNSTQEEEVFWYLECRDWEFSGISKEYLPLFLSGNNEIAYMDYLKRQTEWGNYKEKKSGL